MLALRNIEAPISALVRPEAASSATVRSWGVSVASGPVPTRTRVGSPTASSSRSVRRTKASAPVSARTSAATAQAGPGRPCGACGAAATPRRSGARAPGRRRRGSAPGRRSPPGSAPRPRRPATPARGLRRPGPVPRPTRSPRPGRRAGRRRRAPRRRDRCGRPPPRSPATTQRRDVEEGVVDERLAAPRRRRRSARRRGRRWRARPPRWSARRRSRGDRAISLRPSTCRGVRPTRRARTEVDDVLGAVADGPLAARGPAPCSGSPDAACRSTASVRDSDPERGVELQQTSPRRGPPRPQRSRHGVPGVEVPEGGGEGDAAVAVAPGSPPRPSRRVGVHRLAHERDGVGVRQQHERAQRTQDRRGDDPRARRRPRGAARRARSR